MSKTRKEKASHIHTDWVVKGLDNDIVKDGLIAISPTSPVSTNESPTAEDTVNCMPRPQYLSDQLEGISLRQHKEGNDVVVIKPSKHKGKKEKSEAKIKKASKTPPLKEHLDIRQGDDGGKDLEVSPNFPLPNNEVAGNMSEGEKIGTSSHVEISPSGSGTKSPGDDFKAMEQLCSEGGKMGMSSHVEIGPSGSGTKSPGDDFKVIEQLCSSAMALDNQGLSNLELDSNAQEQIDEITALESICGSDFILVKAMQGVDLKAFMVLIRIDVSTGLRVTINMPHESNGENGEPGYDKLHACSLQYLPPIKLMCIFPKSYPSHSPPTFNLWSHWLNSARLSSLCQSLDRIWEDQVGQVVVFSWIDWLHTCTLSHLGIQDELDIGSAQERSLLDDRAVSGYSSPDVDIPMFIRYNEDQKDAEFNKGVHLCHICFTEQSGWSFAKLQCKHYFCYVCMKQYASVHINEGTVNKIRCPDTSCKESISPTLLKDLLGEEAFQRWERLLLQKTLDSMADVVYCPRCKMVCIEDKDNSAQCGQCFYSFCTLCRGTWHSGQECMTPDAKLRILQEREKGCEAGNEERKKVKDLINEILNLKYVKREAKQCPTCKMAIEKTEGCNKITCENCGKYFCYVCNKAIDGYDHFSNKCNLFEEAQIQIWQRPVNPRRFVPEDVPEDVPGGAALFRFEPCPNCAQLNVKDGNNNHIFCWSCQQHYCALCRQLVRRSSEHFGSGPRKCKQHTRD